MAEEYVADVGGGSTGTYYPQDFDLAATHVGFRTILRTP